MGAIVTFFFVAMAVAILGLALIAHRSTEVDRNTREWIAFLQDDPSRSPL